ncbi:MAG: hypothetical protein HY699_09875 [Deltaproteobacteria bacterium]|nr:hypothetical protein [Deltaproteobacteria bacterium]
MKTRLLSILALALSAVAVRAVSEGPPVPKEVREVAQVFTERMMVVKGEGAAPSDRPLGGGQKRLLAQRAAKVVALRELAETLAGVRVAGDTSVQDAAARSDQIRTAVDGMVKGAETVYEGYDERAEIATVYLRLNLDGPNGVTGNLLPKIVEQRAVEVPAAPVYAPPVPAAPAPPAAVEVADGLIIDATGKNFRPALINRIVASNGSVLFEPSKIAPEVLAKRGCGDYTSDLGKAKAILANHGAKNPIVVVATGVVRSTDAQVSESDAAAIFTNNGKSNFLESAKVVFVL